MHASEILALFGTTIPNDYPKHMFCYFAAHAARGSVKPFTAGIVRSLGLVELAAPGYAKDMISRMSAVLGTGEMQYEALIQIVAEIYVTAGAIESADHDEEGRILFAHEPGASSGKNPEFETRAENIWYAVEVKTPKLIDHSRRRATTEWQLTARMPKDFQLPTETPLLPRDNPIKDFLISASDKFSAYAVRRPEAYRILTIIWDDFVNEPLSALLHPNSGLLTEHSFYKEHSGIAVQFPMIDAVILCRYQHQIIRLTREEPPIDGAGVPLGYHYYTFPPKVLVQNPIGRVIPEILLQPLNATPLNDCFGAEHNPMGDLIMWVGGSPKTEPT